MQIVPKERLDELRKTMRSLDLEVLVQKISRQFMVKKLMNKAMLDASKINGADFTGKRLGYIGELVPFQKIARIQSWLENARHNKTKNQNLKHELRKIKVLKTTEVPMA